MMPKNLLNPFLRTTAVKFIHRYERNKNPGIQKRMDILDEKDLSKIETFDIEELENQFMNPLELKKDFMQEVERVREKEQLYLVRNKYFKEKHINFLTYNDKEQIRYLHNKDPGEWTIEKLSESFPALPETISKILKSNWIPKNQNRIKNHDLSVEKNWVHMKEGKLPDLSPILEEHLKKFSNRKHNVIENNKIVIKQQNTETIGQFASILKSYEEQRKKIKDNQYSATNKEVVQEVDKESLNWNRRNQKSPKFSVTLSKLKEDIVSNINSGRNVDEYDRILASNINMEKTPQKTILEEKPRVVMNTDKSTEIIKTDPKPSDLITYPQRIKIPKSKYKEGFLYKLNDCYYDDDGEFLYRVPGMD